MAAAMNRFTAAPETVAVVADQACLSKPRDLVGKFVDIEGRGIGRVESFAKTNLPGDSKHHIFFAGSDEACAVVLRRRKFPKGWIGEPFQILKEPEDGAAECFCDRPRQMFVKA